MSARFLFFASPYWMLALALFLAPMSSPAAPIRVTTWDLRPAAVAGTNGLASAFRQNLVQGAADSLRKLHPDVILLQQVPDWEMCRQLAQALQPETYHVAICSSFRDTGPKPTGRQVAILSTAKAYLAWAEPWRQGLESPAAPGGFAFAAVRIGSNNIGFFSVQFSDADSSGEQDHRTGGRQRAREESARQLVKQIASLQQWKNNRLQTFVVAGDFNTPPDDSRLPSEKTLALLQESGFDNAFDGLPSTPREALRGNGRRNAATLDYIFTANAGSVSPPLVTQSAVGECAAVTCEMDLALPKAIPAAPQPIARTEPPPIKPVVTNTPTPLALPPPAVAKASVPPVSHRGWWWLAGFLGSALALYLLARTLIRQREPELVSSVLPDPHTSIEGGIASSPPAQIVVSSLQERPPFVHIETEGSMQTQSQTWPPRAEIGRLTPRVTEAVREGVIANLSRWLKQKAVQRLVSDRERLLATQQAAGLKVLAVDQRLARIEHQIRQINQQYERRIDDLLQELAAAKEENRELIHAKIALVKAEMEKARLKSDLQGREHPRY